MIIEIILGLLILVEGYVIWNLFRKTELLENWVENFTQQIQIVQNQLKEVDDKGMFEADDEVGTIFKRIKQIVNELDNVKGEEINVNK
ncbi:hypothetical protein HOE22_03350 [Candidatus Woesearchaeota archaeon]|jgi:hypothetical protein|nr:hypothetical protein [Candidatus Woesearchaeota archaeon]MBT4732954.1 hypothetical protein [Candidatus Woesearchaeota archaeon]MBT7557358.1 hypothetical protein [Candidatus Woesearchaeota archaeon]